MEEKIEQQKQLIIKAKITIDKLRAELAENVSQLQEEKSKNEKMELILEKYLQEEKSIVCERVLAKIKVEEIVWLCIKNAGIEWVRESEFNKIMDPNLHQGIQLLDYQKTKDDILIVVQQYDQRMKLLQQECSQNEQKVKELQLKYSDLQNELEKYKIDQIDNISEIIQQSQQIRDACLTQMDSSIDTETEIKVLLLQLQKLNYPILSNLKQHLRMLNQTIYELIQSQQETNNLIEQQEKEQKQRLLEIEEERSMEREQKMKHFENGRLQIEQLEKNIEILSKELKEKNMKLELFNQENKKNANVQFFTEEYSVKRKTIPVIATVLQFTEQELQTVQQAWDRDSKSIFGRFFK